MKSIVNASGRQVAALFVSCFLLLSSAITLADDKAVAGNPGPAAVVETLTTQLLDMARVGQEKMKKEPEKFYGEIETVLEPVVSFKFIAQNVMGGTYWSQATEAQQQQFLKVFKRSLVETYVKGMSQNLDYKLEILDDQSKIAGNKASIVQKITGPDSTNHVVYSLGQGTSGQWKVLNVVLDGVNLGKTFRSQFAQGVKENNGNIQATIAGWAKT